MFSRRDLLKFFGISATAVVLPKITEAKTSVPNANTFNFVNFEEWLKATTKSIRENKLYSFVFKINEKELSIDGRTDCFVENYLNGIKDNFIPRDYNDVHITFSVERKLIPENFAKWIKDKHGRSIFVNMSLKNELNNIKDVGKYLIKCDEKSSKNERERFSKKKIAKEIG